MQVPDVPDDIASQIITQGKINTTIQAIACLKFMAISLLVLFNLVHPAFQFIGAMAILVCGVWWISIIENLVRIFFAPKLYILREYKKYVSKGE